MENLLEALASVLDDVPDQPLMPEWIGIQSRGMKQWISIQLAQKFGVCANTRFVFPKEFIDLILSNFEPLSGEIKTIDQDFLFWKILKQIYQSRLPIELESIQNYIADDAGGKKRFQLAAKIAQVFDNYQVYRPDMLLNWQKKTHAKTGVKDPAELWQAHLWKQISANTDEANLAYTTQMFFEQFSPEKIRLDNLPARISFLGISSLPPVFFQMFAKVSQFIDIHLFLLVPSNQFFFDIPSEKQMEKIALKENPGQHPDQLYFETSNPLLSSLGTTGKTFLSFLETFDYHEPYPDLFEDALEHSSTMLAVLQSDILNLISRNTGQGETPVPIQTGDTSISVHACHSPMREAQVLKDLLLEEFEKDPDLAPHDVIVMMPDIESYAPFIESVFSLEHHIGFSISDRKKRSESDTLTAFLKILALKNHRLEKSQVLDLLLSEAISEKFDIHADEISLIQKLTDDANILWGRDAEHRKKIGLPGFGENTWQFGLDRLFMGMAMPEDHDTPVQDILPCPSLEGLELEVLGKFAGFVQSVFSSLNLLEGQKTIGQWSVILKKITAAMLEQNPGTAEDISFLIQTIESLHLAAQTTEFNAPVFFDVIHSYLEQKLDLNVSQGNFLAGKITFCNLMPMRSIPYKMVVLMGMDEKSFPRKSIRPGFDLIKKFPQPGDKNERDEDRYLFLETLLSARSKFIVTYTGMSVQDNSPLPCSGVISEFCDTIDRSFLFENEYAYHRFHPLHPFNESYFFSPPLSYSQNYCKIANALKFKEEHPFCFIRPDGCYDTKTSISDIDLAELIRFFKNPIQGFMQQTLNIQLPMMDELKLDRESFKVSGLEQYVLGSYLVEQTGGSPPVSDLYPALKASGTLPFGAKGQLEYQRIKSIADPMAEAVQALSLKKEMPGTALQTTVSGVNISSALSGIFSDGAYFVGFGKLNGPRLLSGWINHLFLNVCAPKNYPKETILIGQDPQNKKPKAMFSFPPLKETAIDYLTVLVDLYIKGMQGPLCFFCDTSWQFALSLEKEHFQVSPKTLSAARYKSQDTWYGTQFLAGDKTNRYVNYCTGDNDPFYNVESLVSSGFVKNTLDVFQPLLEHLRRVS